MLADAGDDFGKVIIGIIVFVIWGIGALVNMAKKQNQQSQQGQSAIDQAVLARLEEARRREAAQSLGRMSGPGTAPLPPPLPYVMQGEHRLQPQPRHGPVVPPMRSLPRQQQRPAQQRPVAQQPQRKPLQQKRKAQPRRAPAAAPPVPQPPAGTFAAETPAVVQSEIGQGTAPASPSRRQAAAAEAASPLRRLTPRTLRQQFILTEILQPPLALRERPLDR
jgi:hypothetical protein